MPQKLLSMAKFRAAAITMGDRGESTPDAERS